MVEIKETIRMPTGAGRIMARTIDEPSTGSKFASFELPMSGWIAATKGVRAVEARGHGSIWRLSRISRHDLSERFPDIPAEQRLAFQGNASALRLPCEFDVALVVVFDDGDEETFGRIRGRRNPLRPGFRPGLRPLMLNCLGRSGSTWVTHVLGQHPEIIAYQPFRLEPRAAGYWMDVLGSLAEPASYTQVLQPEVTGEDWWLGRGRKKAVAIHQIDEEMARWLGGDALETLAAFCLGRVEEFYQVVARGQAKSRPRFFVERSYGIGAFAPRIMRELYPDAREIFLVRDFRDVFCSMKSFKGSSLPRRHMAADDVSYIRNQLREYIAGLYKGWLNRRDVAHLLRYEDLIRDPTETLADLFRYAGVANDPATIDEVLDRALGSLPERQAAHKTAADPLSSIGRWRDELDPDLQRAFTDSMGNVLEEFGYPRDRSPVGAKRG